MTAATKQAPNVIELCHSLYSAEALFAELQTFSACFTQLGNCQPHHFQRGPLQHGSVRRNLVDRITLATNRQDVLLRPPNRRPVGPSVTHGQRYSLAPDGSSKPCACWNSVTLSWPDFGPRNGLLRKCSSTAISRNSFEFPGLTARLAICS